MERKGADVDIGFVIVGVAGTALVTWANYVGIKTASYQPIVTVLIVLSGLLLISGATLFGEPENTMHFVEPAIGGLWSFS